MEVFPAKSKTNYDMAKKKLRHKLLLLLSPLLSMIPDEANVEGLTPGACNLWTAAPSNFILDQARRAPFKGVGGS
jgi:hypothetical protein